MVQMEQRISVVRVPLCGPCFLCCGSVVVLSTLGWGYKERKAIKLPQIVGRGATCTQNPTQEASSDR